jgi:predicted ArsR family transcriptional regulator
VENTIDLRRTAKAGLGPAPTEGSSRSLSASRAALLATLRAQCQPTTLAALVRSSGLHENTVREHLDALVKGGLASRHRAEASGRGRPAWLYEATDAPPGGGNEYAGLAVALAETIRHCSPTPVEDSVAAGRSWGRDLARRQGAEPERTAIAGRRQVVALLDDLGFGPKADARVESVRLTRCPLLEAAHRSPDVVCAVHLGLTQGALEEFGADPEGARLRPFAEPGLCRLRLTAPRS